MIIAIIIILVVISFVVYMISKGKKIVVNSNPIDGIHDGGTMGFLLGDKYKFCLSRLKHLGIKIDSNDFEDEFHQLMVGSTLGSHVTWGTNEFNNIKNVDFRFKNKSLSSISIYVDYSQSTIEEMYYILLSRLARVLQREPNISTNEISKWFSNKGSVSLMIFKDDYSQNKEKKLLIQVL